MSNPCCSRSVPIRTTHILKGPECKAYNLLPVKIAPWVGLLELGHQVRLLDVLDEVILANLKQIFFFRKCSKNLTSPSWSAIALTSTMSSSLSSIPYLFTNRQKSNQASCMSKIMNFVILGFQSYLMDNTNERR